MQTQVNCPNCRTPFPTQVFQIVDAQRQPELKQMLLAGALNVANCPNCGAQIPLGAPLLYHDAEHELMMVYVPMELNLPMHEQDRLVSQLTKAIVDSVPQNQVKGYMIRPPQMMLSMQSFMEKVYETEGITPEMLQRQRDQSQLLQELVTVEREERNQKIADKADLIDESFVAMVQSNLQAIEQQGQNPQVQDVFVKISNLQAYLFKNTEVGREFMTAQVALAKFQKEAQAAGGLNLELLLKHLLLNLDNERVQDSIIRMGQQGIRYELFDLLTTEIDGEEDEARKEQMVALREKLLMLFESMQSQAQELMEKAKGTLDILLAAGQNLPTAIQNNAADIDENFLYFLEASINQAEQQGDSNQAFQLKQLQSGLMAEAEKQLPPEVRLINSIVKAETDDQLKMVLRQIPQAERPQTSQLLEAMAERAEESDPEAAAKLKKAKSMLLFL